MKRQNENSVGDILRAIFQDTTHRVRLQEAQAVRLWTMFAGEHMASLCGKPFVNRGIMTVRVPSAALRHELWISRSSMISMINKHLGETIITDIRFIG